MKIHNFNRSLFAGLNAELEIAKLYPQLKKLSGARGDFEAPNGAVIELKCDSYDADKTNNFFIERYSNLEKQTPGGPWQAHEHGCTYYWYMFTRNKRMYCFKVSELLELLSEDALKNFESVEVQNEGYVTFGLKVNISYLLHCATVVQF